MGKEISTKVGKVGTILSKIKTQETRDLMARFKHIVGAQAIKAYIAAKPDRMLDIEVRLMQEELENRIRPKSPLIIIKSDKSSEVSGKIEERVKL